MSDWRIYYGDSATYSGNPEQAPTRNVQAIVQSDERVGWYMQSRGDYYVYEDGVWRGCDIFGLFDYLVSPGWKRVLFGRTLTNEEYQAIFKRATEDADFGRKSGYLPDERRGSP